MIKLTDLLSEKIKPKQKISKKEWSKIKKFNKHIGQDGTHYVTQLDKRLGTILVPVVVEGKLTERTYVSNVKKVGKLEKWTIVKGGKKVDVLGSKKFFDDGKGFSKNDPDDALELWNLGKKFKGKQVPDVYGEGKLTEIEDHEGSMAKSQLERSMKYSKMIYDMINNVGQGGEVEFPAWVQSKLTKSMDYLQSVFNYLDGKDGIEDKFQTTKLGEDEKKKKKKMLLSKLKDGKLNEKMDRKKAAIILKQIGGNKFIAMTGAKGFAFSDKFMSFKIGKNSKGINFVRIGHNAKDLYDMEFGFVSVRGIKVKNKVKDVYADMLGTMFEKYTGMRTSL